jgi:hypothetical protein
MASCTNSPSNSNRLATKWATSILLPVELPAGLLKLPWRFLAEHKDAFLFMASLHSPSLIFKIKSKDYRTYIWSVAEK